MSDRMKTALITPFDTGNIGTTLQAYATQQLIMDMGYDNEILYFHYESIQNPFLLSNLKKRGIKKYICSIGGYFVRLPAKKNLWRFIQNHIKITEKLNHDKMQEIESRYDYIIVGSDCVWNGDDFNLETAYLLDWVQDNTKKGNFASSFAADNIPMDQRSIFNKYLSCFSKLSVREERGKEIIKELTGKDATVVLDPTLTQNCEFWNKIADSSRIEIEEKYIFVAEYAASSALLYDAELISKKSGLPIYCLYPPKGKFLKAKKIFYNAGPEDVVNLIRYAEYVFTDSYHMMIFSINYCREFFAYRTYTNIASSCKHRSILECLHLENRMFLTENVKKNSVDITMSDKIDYNSVTQKLEEQRKISKNYLENLLNEAAQNIIKNAGK